MPGLPALGAEQGQTAPPPTAAKAAAAAVTTVRASEREWSEHSPCAPQERSGARRHR